MGLVHSTISIILKDKEQVKEMAKTTVGYNALIARQQKGLIERIIYLMTNLCNDGVTGMNPVLNEEYLFTKISIMLKN